VALSTADKLAVLDISGPSPRRLTELSICAFPDALASLPGGGVVVSCRFDAALRVVTRLEGAATRAAFRVRAVEAGPEHGHRDVAVDSSGHLAYVTSPARGGVNIIDLWSGNVAPRFVPTGLFPVSVVFVPSDGQRPGAQSLLLVANFVGHTIGVYPVGTDGGLGPPIQTIATAAPVRDLAVVRTSPAAADGLAGLVLATHEDRALSRERVAIEGLDSVLLILAFGPEGAVQPFVDPGPGKRRTLNLCERDGDPIVSLESLAVDPIRGRIAIVGAGTDNVLTAAPTTPALMQARAAVVGGNPSAVVFLPDGRIATADRLTDTVSFVDIDHETPVVATAVVGRPERPTPAERGEVLFYSRALVPNNVATGPLSLYTCAACHADGHIDGRRHPSKRNRFFSMTKTCRGLPGTEPFLSLGHPDTFAAFADNIVATHAQGALDAPETYDQYPVPLRLRHGDRWSSTTLSSAEVRVALAEYMARIPQEPSPFASGVGFTAAERRGLAVFRGRCSGCHQLLPATNSVRSVAAAALPRQLRRGQLVLTSARRYDVGTPVLGEGGNNPPSLRGTWAAAPYFSDGSATTLEEVVRRTDPKAERVHAPDNLARPPALSAEDQAALVAFLRGL